MEREISDLIIDLATKTAKIETQLNHHTEMLIKIESSLTPIVEKVHSHSTIIKIWSWMVGVIASFITAKFLGKF